MARTGHFIYLRTRGYLDIDRDTNQVRSFVCHNTLVDEEEGKKLVNEMKKKFAIMIHETDFSTTETDVAGVENPEQIVDAVLSLVTDLQVPGDYSIEATVQHHTVDVHDPDRSVTSPPLNIIAPNRSTIKSSITKSVTVIGNASKCMRYNTRRSDDSGSDRESELDGSEKRWRPSVVQGGRDNGNSNGNGNNRASHDYSNGQGKHLPDTDSYVKREMNERVPPLPTSDGYFDSGAYSGSPISNPAISPAEFKPFDCPAQGSESHQYLPTSTTTGRHNSACDTPPPVRNDLKRSHCDDDFDSEAKRRYRASVLYDGSNTSLQQSCIDDLINPDLGMREKSRSKNHLCTLLF